MGKKLKEYVQAYQCLLESDDKIENIEEIKKELLAEIQFWQHERFIHLIVTVLFALLTMMVMVSLFFYEMMSMDCLSVLILLGMLLVLLVPYIRHYYILENGVQALYTFYEELTKREGKIPESLVPKRKGVYIKPLKK